MRGLAFDPDQSFRLGRRGISFDRDTHNHQQDTNTNTQLQKHKYKYTNQMIVLLEDSSMDYCALRANHSLIYCLGGKLNEIGS